MMLITAFHGFLGVNVNLVLTRQYCGHRLINAILVLLGRNEAAATRDAGRRWRYAGDRSPLPLRQVFLVFQ